MAGIAAPNIVKDGLVFYIDAANLRSYPGSGTTWFDIISSDNGTLSSSPTFVNVNNGVIDFDSTDYVSTPITETFWNSLDATTVNTWCKPDTLTDSATSYVFCAGEYNVDSASSRGRMIGIAQYNNRWYVAGGPSNFQDTSVNVSNNTWICFSWSINLSSNTSTFYINGLSVGNYTLHANDMRSDSVTLIGKYSGQGLGTTTGLWRGYISNTQIYNRALSAQEVKQNYNALKGRFGL
jgi:hypothetical protein